MSWLTDIIRGRKTKAEILARSWAYAKKKIGQKITDKDIDGAQKAAEDFGNQLQVLIEGYIKTRFPFLPPAVVHIIVDQVFGLIDGFVASAANQARMLND